MAKTRMICQTKANLLIWLVFVFSRCQLIGHKVKIEFFQHLTSRWTLRFFVIKILPRTKKTFHTLANSSFIEYIREYGEFVSPVVVFGQEYTESYLSFVFVFVQENRSLVQLQMHITYSLWAPHFSSKLWVFSLDFWFQYLKIELSEFALTFGHVGFKV